MLVHTFTVTIIYMLTPPQHMQAAETYPPRDLLLPPRAVVGPVWSVAETRLHTKQIPLPDGGFRPEVRGSDKQFTVEVLRLDPEGRPVTVLRHYLQATERRDAQTLRLDHDGAHVLLERRGDAWTPSVYRLRDGNRVDVAANPVPLRRDALLADTQEQAYGLLTAHLPDAPLALQDSWQVDPAFLGDALESLTGLVDDETLLHLTLREVTDTRIVLALGGTVTFAATAKGGARMRWQGKLSGGIVLARGPYRELSRHLTVDETVTLTLDGRTVTGTGKLTLSRTMSPVPPKS